MHASSDSPSLTQLRPERRLLLCCGRTVLDAETSAEMAQLLRQEINWPFLLQFAAHHGLVPLLYWHLNANFADLVPPKVLQQLRQEFMVNAQHNLYLTRELIKLLELLDTNHIPAIPYKGPVLAVTAYRNVSFRQFCDLDILVQQQHVLRTMELFSANGYQLATHLNDGVQPAHLLSKKKDYKFISNDGRSVVELHWRLTGKHFYFAYDLAQIFRRLVPTTLAGSTLLNFTPEDYLLILCAHGAKHFWLRLLWISDISELIRTHTELDWTQLLKRAQACGSKRMLLLGLHLAREFFGTELPPQVVAEIEADGEVQPLTAEVIHQVFFTSDDIVGKTELSPYEYYPLYIRMRERWREKLRLQYQYYRTYLHVVVTPNNLDRELVELPPFFNFLYYLLRPMRLLKERSMSRLKLFQRKQPRKSL